jgi:hypothetical protein
MTLDIKTIPPVVIEPGTYGQITIESDENYYYLKQGDVIWHQYTIPNMREYLEQWSSYDIAYGDVLLTGFGFGQIATWLASKTEVKSITVIEISQDVVDAFLKNNTMPDNVTVIIADANFFNTDKKYDCIIFDHIPNGSFEASFYKELTAVAKKIQHDLFWFWSIEHYYLKFYYGITDIHIQFGNIDYSKFDFGRSWEKLRSVLDMPSIPRLPKSKLDSYINSYFLI